MRLSSTRLLYYATSKINYREIEMTEEKTKLEKAQEKFEQAKARLKQEQARAKTKDRKDDTRRKILLGAALIATAKNNPATQQQIKDLVGGMSQRDQALFKQEGQQCPNNW